MKFNELRIGNLILHKNYKESESLDECVIFMIAEDHLRARVNGTHNEAISAGYCEGIELNEEWLSKLGFKKSIANGTYYLNIEGNFELIYDGEFKISLEGYRKALDIEYVHQLQNLFFALTGQELTIKELA